MAKWTLPDMISRAEADRQTQEAVAAVLMEAARLARAAPDGEIAYDDILALAADAPFAILAKWGARVRKEALMDAAIYFGVDEETAEEMIAAIWEGEA